MEQIQTGFENSFTGALKLRYSHTKESISHCSRSAILRNIVCCFYRLWWIKMQRNFSCCDSPADETLFIDVDETLRPQIIEERASAMLASAMLQVVWSHLGIGVEDGGPGGGAKIQGKIFFGQLLCKIRAFFGQKKHVNHVFVRKLTKFGNFVNF